MTARERTIHKGPCAECGLPMIDQREWKRNPAIRPGRTKHAGYGRCQTCYMRGYRHNTLPRVTVTGRYPVECSQCGPLGEAASRDEANRIRAEHLQGHGAALPASSVLSAVDLARLRQQVGLVAS